MSYLFHLYKNMTADSLVRHYAYLTQALVRYTTSNENREAMEAHVQRFAKKSPPNNEKESRSRRPRGQLNATKALKIYRSRKKHTDLAKEYGVHHVTISDIKHGRSWTHVTGHPKYVRGGKK